MKSLRILTILVLSAGLFGCSKMSNNSGGSNAVLSQTAAARKVVAVVSRNQLLPNYLTCTGLPAENVSNATRTEADAALSKLAEEGDVEYISAPMLMAFVKVGAEVCNDLITYENNEEQRRFFMGFNLGNNNINSGQPDMGTTINALAGACWGRAPTATEVNMIMNNVSQTALGDATNRNAALYVCTAILGSSSAVKF